MHPIVNHLIQLQELQLIRDEQKVATGGGHFEQVNASIDGLIQELPANVRMMFEKLHKRDHVVIVPIHDGICTACGMRLPISHVQAVRQARQVEVCPNCARMLYFPESGPRRVSRTRRRTEPEKVGISRFSSHTLMVPRLVAEDKESAIRELAYKIEAEGFIDGADKFVEEALRRETILSTAVEHGLAFPHVRGVEGGGLTFALGISAKGIPFGEAASKLTRIVFLISIPTAASAFYLKLLAGLAETFMKADARKTLVTEKDPEKLWKLLIKLTRTTIK